MQTLMQYMLRSCMNKLKMTLKNDKDLNRDVVTIKKVVLWWLLMPCYKHKTLKLALTAPIENKFATEREYCIMCVAEQSEC